MADIRMLPDIDRASQERLKAAGIHSTDTLLIRAAATTGRAALAASSGVDGDTLLAWVNMADLLRVTGVGLQYVALLQRAGTTCVADLAACEPETLLAEMRRVHETQPLVRQLPRLSTLREWITHARGLKPRVM